MNLSDLLTDPRLPALQAMLHQEIENDEIDDTVMRVISAAYYGLDALFEDLALWEKNQ